MTAEKVSPKRRIIKKSETIREKAEKKAIESNRPPRRIHTTRRRASIPFQKAGNALAKLGKFKPLRIVGLVLFPPYFRNSWKELLQVTWPKLRVSIRLTFAVISFATVFGILVALLDFGLDKLFKQVLLK